ncbi:MAG TPA: GGDEF domain-containing protein, partial [bacterium]|nr:GGDEF domain-containing protein [bacterium]
MSAPVHRPSYRQAFLFSVIGVLLGLGAPLGALALLWFGPHPELRLPSFVFDEWRDHLFFFTYMLAGTSLSFGLFGFFLGRHADAIWHQNRRLTDQVLTDPLTGLGNHRFLHEAFQEEAGRQASGGRPLSCLMLDLDHFKRVNDTYGHPFGDEVLRGVAARIREGLRPGDRAARYGGEEFLCLLPDCDAAAARGVAERVRAAVEAKPFQRGG